MKLIVGGLAFEYKSKKVLKDVSFKIGKNEFISILGPNGVGKTTLLRCLNRILKPSRGNIILDDEDLFSLSREEIAREISYVSQKSESNRLTAFDAILMGRIPYVEWKIRASDIEKVHSIIRALNLEDLSLRYIDEMSGGELQKVCIARALVQEPNIILLDEPTSSLDLKNQQEILKLITEIIHSHNLSTIMTVHDINTALHFSDKILFLKGGIIYNAIKPEEVTAEIIEEVYEVKVKIHQVEGKKYIFPE